MKALVLRTAALVFACSVSTVALAAETETYVAQVSALNAGKIGHSASGKATFKVEGGNLVVEVEMKGTPPDIEHWEHFHGFPNADDARCPTEANDANKDGFIDLIETGQTMGTTMVPFNHAPEQMDIPTDTYPKADAHGNYHYTKVIPLAKLQEKFGHTFAGGKIDLDKRVFMVHGVPKSFEVPASVAGDVGPYNTHVTLPIACGKIEKVK